MKYAKPKTKRKYKRMARTTKDEKAVVKAIVREAGGDLSPDKTTALAKVFNRPVATVKAMISSARQNLAADAEFYVDTHRQVVEQATAIGVATANEKALDVARKGAAWALENISGEGRRIIEKQESGPAGTRIMIGVKLSNTTIQPDTTIDISADAIEAEVLDGA